MSYNRVVYKLLFLFQLLYLICLVSCSDEAAPASDEADFSHFEFAYILGNATINHIDKTIYAEIDATADMDSIIPSFVLSNMATAYINNKLQISGVTANDFSKIVEYKLVAADGKTTNLWTVTISKKGGSAGGHNDQLVSINSNTVLTAGKYYVKQDLAVSEGVYLEISPGAQIFFEKNSKFIIGNKSIVNAVGSTSKPIQFMPIDSSNPWYGISLNGSTATFEYCHFQYGGTTVPMIDIRNSKISVKFCEVRDVPNTGLYVDKASKISAFNYNTISNCGENIDKCYPIILNSINTISAIGNENQITTQKGIFVEECTADDNISINGINCPYIFRDDIVSNTMNKTFFIHDGSTIMMSKGKKILMGQNGAVRFEARGTTEHPVTFATMSQQAGDWEGIHLGKFLLPNSALTNCNIYFAGNGVNSGAIYCNGTDTTHFTVEKCAVAFTNSHGIFFTKGSTAVINDVVYSGIPAEYSNIYYSE